MDNIFGAFLSQMLVQIPILLMYVIGMILALMFWRRCRGPSLLTLLAMMLLLVTKLVQSFLFLYLVRAKEDFGWSYEDFNWILSANGLFGNFISAAAFGLVLIAVFSGRNATQPSAPNV